ncbi:alpha/beta fold hydrolase [Antrihabitans sp. YC2-6]|uniref:alpha/beta fold hydrolase n=1 Tax=Antrihabitans sp. YC2-6 TaxID=2799498 RepID=UPI0018F65CC0|nr:alpha/beta hydrolase [Antrihabitans sp. YC2-6]MBJ8343324.1 alpha/beta hydrolase [Antrihabitans sp. YC2-6]
MPHAEVNGQRLYYEESGSGAPIVFSHGFLMDHDMFDAQVEALHDRYRCITWDERGHGQTVTTPEPFTYWDSAADVLGLLDHLGIERAVLAGMSQGGYLSMRAALTAPERVRGLVLIDTQPGTEDPAKIPAYDQLIAMWEADGVSDQLADIVAGIIIGPGYDRTSDWQDKWRARDTATVRQIYTTLTTREDDIRSRLGELTMPTLVIHGSADMAIELDRANEYITALPNAELAVVEGGGHASNMTHPDKANPLIERFLAGLSG